MLRAEGICAAAISIPWLQRRQDCEGISAARRIEGRPGDGASRAPVAGKKIGHQGGAISPSTGQTAGSILEGRQMALLRKKKAGGISRCYGLRGRVGDPSISSCWAALRRVLFHGDRLETGEKPVKPPGMAATCLRFFFLWGGLAARTANWLPIRCALSTGMCEYQSHAGSAFFKVLRLVAERLQ